MRLAVDENEYSQSNSMESPSMPSTDPLVGTTLDGRFHIEEVLGTGGMSVVYKAKQMRVNRYVAIKTLRMQVEEKPNIRERFMREINSLCALNHPNIVTVYDCVFGYDDQPYIVMDYLQGLSLEALLKRDGPLDFQRFASISLQTMSGVDHAHRKGIVHRDLKPGNIVLVDNESINIKVVDFGLVKLGQEERKLTRSGELWGSPPYMSPEQAHSGTADERSDVYSMGAVMFEMLTGKDPFYDSKTIYELIQAHIYQKPPAFADSNPNVMVPPGVQRVIYKAMEKDPADRFQTMSEMHNALMEAVSGKEHNQLAEPTVRAALGSTYDKQRAATTKEPPKARTIKSSFDRQAYVEPPNALKSLPWIIAACSLIMALCLGVVVIKLLSTHDEKETITQAKEPEVKSTPDDAQAKSREIPGNASSIVSAPADSDLSEKELPERKAEKASPSRGNTDDTSRKVRSAGRRQDTTKPRRITQKPKSTAPSTDKDVWNSLLNMHGRTP